jgi:hypothetical protein
MNWEDVPIAGNVMTHCWAGSIHSGYVTARLLQCALFFEEDSRNEHTIVGRRHSDLRIHIAIACTSSTSATQA